MFVSWGSKGGAGIRKSAPTSIPPLGDAVSVTAVSRHRIQHFSKHARRVAELAENRDKRLLPPLGVCLLARVHPHAAALIWAGDTIVVVKVAAEDGGSAWTTNGLKSRNGLL